MHMHTYMSISCTRTLQLETSFITIIFVSNIMQREGSVFSTKKLGVLNKYLVPYRVHLNGQCLVNSQYHVNCFSLDKLHETQKKRCIFSVT